MFTHFLRDQRLLFYQYCLFLSIIVHSLHLVVDYLWVEIWELQPSIFLQLLQTVLEYLLPEALNKLNQFVIPPLLIKLYSRSKLLIPVLPTLIVLLNIKHLAIRRWKPIQMKCQFFQIHLTIYNM